jgi:hypothetical protein
VYIIWQLGTELPGSITELEQAVESKLQLKEQPSTIEISDGFVDILTWRRNGARVLFTRKEPDVGK